MTMALTGARLFDGERMRDGHAVVIEGERIAGVVPEAGLDAALPRRRIAGLLAPGFVDVQVNGGGGVLFNDQPDVTGIRAIGAAHRRFGTTGFLPTLITDRPGRMAAAIAAVRDALAAGVPGVLGIHLEGPFLSPARKGAHDAGLMRRVEAADIAVMTSLRAGRCGSVGWDSCPHTAETCRTSGTAPAEPPWSIHRTNGCTWLPPSAPGSECTRWISPRDRKHQGGR